MTAQEAYTKQLAEIQEKLDKLQSQIDLKWSTGEVDYRHVGDLNHINELLTVTLNFMGVK